MTHTALLAALHTLTATDARTRLAALLTTGGVAGPSPVAAASPVCVHRLHVWGGWLVGRLL